MGHGRDTSHHPFGLRLYVPKKMNNLTINTALKNDLEQILDLQKEAYASEAQIYNDFSIPPLLQTLEDLENEFESNIFFKVEINGKIIGSVRAYQENGKCYIGKLIVSPAHQNQGLGSKLLKQIELQFSHVEKYILFTGAKSDKNLHIYKKYGYQITNQRKVSDNLTIVFLCKNNTIA